MSGAGRQDDDIAGQHRHIAPRVAAETQDGTASRESEDLV